MPKIKTKDFIILRPNNSQIDHQRCGFYLKDVYYVKNKKYGFCIYYKSIEFYAGKVAKAHQLYKNVKTIAGNINQAIHEARKRIVSTENQKPVLLYGKSNEVAVEQIQDFEKKKTIYTLNWTATKNTFDPNNVMVVFDEDIYIELEQKFRQYYSVGDNVNIIFKQNNNNNNNNLNQLRKIKTIRSNLSELLADTPITDQERFILFGH